MNYNKQNKNEINVNTRGYRFMNRDGFCPSTLVCGYWNEMISLKIHPALPESSQTQSQVYDYNQVLATSLSLEKALILIKKTQELIYPAIQNNQDKSIAVLIGGNNLVQIGYKAEMKASYIGIHKGLDPESKKPQDSLYYQFVDSSEITIEDYDPETGNYSATTPVECELQTFIEILKSSVRALSGAFSHDIRYKLCNDLSQIGSKLGLDLSSGGGYVPKNNISFSKSMTDQPSGTQTQINNIADMSDIDKFLD